MFLSQIVILLLYLFWNTLFCILSYLENSQFLSSLPPATFRLFGSFEMCMCVCMRVCMYVFMTGYLCDRWGSRSWLSLNELNNTKILSLLIVDFMLNVLSCEVAAVVLCFHWIVDSSNVSPSLIRPKSTHLPCVEGDEKNTYMPCWFWVCVLSVPWTCWGSVLNVQLKVKLKEKL